MKVSMLQENLASALVAAKPFASKSGTLPICGMVRLTTDRGMLRVDTTDLEKGFSTWVGSMVEEEGGICVSHDKLTAFVRTLPSDRLDIDVTTVDATGEPTIDSGSMVMTIRSGADDTEATFNGVAVADFPPMVDTEPEDPKVVLFDPDSLATNIRRVQMVAAKDDSRPVLTGISLTFDEDGYEMAAADGFRLAIQRGTAVEAPDEDLQVIISARTLGAVEKLLKDTTESPVRVIIDQANSRARFEIGKHLVMAQLMGGQFPNYAALVPDNLPWQVQVDAKSLKGAVESAAVYAVEGSNIIRIWAEEVPTPEDPEVAAVQDGNGLVRVSARTEDIGYAKREARFAEVSGLDDDDDNIGRIAFNSRYLNDVLKVSDGPVVLAAHNPSSPGLWTFPNAAGYKQVVMPMYVQW